MSVHIKFDDGNGLHFKPGAVGYRCDPAPKKSRISPGSWREGKPDPAGHTWHPHPKGYKLTPIKVVDTKPGERLLFFLPWLDIMALYVGTVQP